MTGFVKYILGIILAAYREFEDRIEVVSEKFSSEEIVERAIQKKIGKFTKSDVMELCPTISKSSVENGIKKLLKKEKIIKLGSGRSTYYVRSDAF